MAHGIQPSNDVRATALAIAYQLYLDELTGPGGKREPVQEAANKIGRLAASLLEAKIGQPKKD